MNVCVFFFLFSLESTAEKVSVSNNGWHGAHRIKCFDEVYNRTRNGTVASQSQTELSEHILHISPGTTPVTVQVLVEVNKEEESTSYSGYIFVLIYYLAVKCRRHCLLDCLLYTSPSPRDA